MPSAKPASPTSTRAARSLFAGLSPSEVAILYADRATTSKSGPLVPRQRVPLSGRDIAADVLGELVLCTVLGALEEAGEVALSVRKRKGLFKVYDVAHLHFTGASEPWPSESPERRIRSWLRDQDEQEGWLDDVIRSLFIPQTTMNPAREFHEHVCLGLLKRGLVEVTKRKVFVLFNSNVYRVPEQHVSELSSVTDRQLRSRLACRERLTPELANKSREAWKQVLKEQFDRG